MNVSSIWSLRPTGVKFMLGLVVALLFSSVAVTPSFADNDRGRRDKHDNRRYENRGRGNDHRAHYDRRYKREYRTYGYRERAYVAPPVTYAPPPPPGISIMFPPIFFRL